MAHGQSGKTTDETDAIDRLAAIALHSQRIASDILAGRADAGALKLDPLNVGGALLAASRSLASDPSAAADAQMRLWGRYLALWQRSARRMAGDETPGEPVAAPAPDDRRFKDPEWSENWFFDHLKQSYLLAAEYLQSIAENVRDLDEKDAAKLRFLHAAVRRCDSPHELPGNQPDGA